MAATFELIEPDRPEAPGLAVRLVRVFVAPGELFDALRERPVWIDAMVVLVLLALAVPLLVPDFDQRYMQQVGGDLDPEVLAQMSSGSIVRQILTVVIFTPIWVAVVAGILLLVYNVILGGEATFRQLFSAVTHANIVLAVGGLFVVVLVALGSNYVVLSPALLLPDLGTGFLGRWLSSVNVFALWTCVVLGIAVSRIYPKRSAGGATTLLFVLYLFVTMLGAAFYGALMNLAASAA